jgi:hypothetical protein
VEAAPVKTREEILKEIENEEKFTAGKTLQVLPLSS